MAQTFNIYCDESCHLENDHIPVMVLGAISCPAEKARGCAEEIRAIKSRHELSPNFEIKWTKVSEGKIDFYIDLLNYFFQNTDLKFRGIIAPKIQLNHEKFNQTHTQWYYKMYFNLLKAIIYPVNCYRIFLDIRDTHGGNRIKTLKRALKYDCNDNNGEIITTIQLVHSHEIELMQLADLLIGAISYLNRGLSTNQGKLKLIENFKQLSGRDLISTTPYGAGKVNLLRWKGMGA